jgi:hypothetical protein
MDTVTYEADGRTRTVRLSPAQRRAILGTFEDGTVSDTSRPTQRALVRLGLADELRGTVRHLNRHGNPTREFHNVFSGSRLNAHVKAVRAILRHNTEGT